MNISADHPEPAVGHTLLADALGTGDYEFAVRAAHSAHRCVAIGKGRDPARIELHAVRGARHQSQGRDGSPAGSSDGSDPQRHHGRRPPPQSRRDHSPAGQRLDHAEQARAHVREPGRGPQEIPLRR